MSSTPDPSSAVPEPVRALVSLFEGPLAELRFPDLDATSLGEAVSEVEARRSELQRALATVQAAREQLESAQAALLTHARKGHAYATVYAAEDEALTASLAEIKLDARSLTPKRRGRRKKAKKKAPPSKSQTTLSVAEHDAA